MNRRKFIFRTGVLLSGAASVDAFYVEKAFIELNEYFPNNNSKNKNGISILQVSDLHIKSMRHYLIDLANKINTLNPDLICITGDALDDKTNFDLLDQWLGMLNNNIPKTAILGNWDYWSGLAIADLKQLYQKHNCQLLINDHQQLTLKNKTISITGIDDLLAGSPNIEAALKTAKQSDYHIILNHCPQYSDEIAEFMYDNKNTYDFILSGHTHGGQFNLFGWKPFLPRGSGKYVKGWYNEANLKMYVSRGIGTSIIPARFLSRAEIAIFYL